ncbi:MAG: phage portal protein, partial [Hungatella sp.]
PAEQIVPILSKNLEKELIGVLRSYQDFSDDGEALTVYEYWDDKVCQSYHVRAGGSFDDDFVSNPVFNVVDNTGEAFVTSEFEHGIGEVPFFHFFNNNIDSGDLDNIKPLIDSYCKVISGFVNDLEDIQEVIFVLTNYGGANLNGFLQDIKKYKVIQLDSDGPDDKSDARMLSIEIPVEARKELMKIMRQCIFEQGQGIDPDPQNFGNSSGVALSFLYSLLELKAGLQETEFKLGFGRFIRCVCRLMGILIKNDTIVQTWTRTSVRNDKEIADICNQSDGILSTETIVEHHPYVDDPAKEMERLEEQQRADEAAQKEISDMFPQSEKKPEELKDKEEGDA